MTHRTIFAFCPEHYRPDYEYLFVAVAGEFVPAARMWTRVGNLAAQFPPEGAVFVPRALLPEPFRPGDVAAWVVQDQPDFQQQGLSTRYRAVRSFHCPPEMVPVPRASDDLAGVQRVLREEGLEVNGPESREVLLEFTDGLIAGPVALEEKPEPPRRFLCGAAALTRPLPAWKGRIALQLLRLEWDSRPRFFVCTDSLPQPQEYLDFATLEDALRSALLVGGLRGGAAPVSIDVETLTLFLQQVRNALPGGQFQARRRRLEQLLEEAQSVASDRALWEKHLVEHPLFKQLVNGAIDRMRDELLTEARRRVLDEENIIRERIRQLEREETTHHQALDRLRGFHEQAASAVELMRQARDSLAEVRLPADGHVHRGADGPASDWEWLSADGPWGTDVATLETPAAAVAHLRGNLERLGLRAESAGPLAQEVFAAASLGQLVMFRGSMAVPVAEAVACSLAGSALVRLAVRTHLTTPLQLPETESEVAAALLERIDRIDLDEAGSVLTRLLRDRALGLGGWPPSPVLVATLAQGKGPVPLSAHGPAFDTDCLSWAESDPAQAPAPGECRAEAWEVSGGEGDVSALLELVESATSESHHVWERNVRAAARRLGGLGCDEQRGTAGLLFGWVLPWLEAKGCGVPEGLRSRLGEAVDDPRVARLLRRMVNSRLRLSDAR